MHEDIKKYFATSSEEAEKRYLMYKNTDPFPNISAALLSSAHIQAYIAKTGMIYPYFPESDLKKEKITSAAMKMTIGREVLYWDTKDKQQYFDKLMPEDEILLRPNSITFLRPAERFNIPDYIAIRFNLRIVHVHRGLLLGTGPLLDPGFQGSPMIPVHNLTDNEYFVRVGDEFINVEFTKISDIQEKFKTDSTEESQWFEYIENQKKTWNHNFIKYIDRNVPQRKVKSSLSAVIDKANILVNQQKIFVTGSIIVAIISIAALVYGGYQLTTSSMSIIDEARNRIENHKIQEETLIHLQSTIKILEEKVKTLQSQIISKSDQQKDMEGINTQLEKATKK